MLERQVHPPILVTAATSCKPPAANIGSGRGARPRARRQRWKNVEKLRVYGNADRDDDGIDGEREYAMRKVMAMAAAIGLGWATGPGAQADLPRAAVPADGKLVLRDYGNRDWGPELVQYRVDPQRFAPGKLVLTDAAGQAVPFQIEGDTLAFVATVGKGQTSTYTLAAAPTDRSREGTTLTFAAAGEWLEVGNEHFTLRLPKVGEQTFAPAIDGAKAPPPLAQWRPAKLGQWLGGARFTTERQVAACAFRVTRQGPACVEYEARYTFAPRGEYVWHVRVTPGAPLAIVTEDFDFGELTAGKDLLLLDLHAGWTPPRIAVAEAGGEERTPVAVKPQPFAAFVEAKRKAGEQNTSNVGGVGAAPQPYLPAPGLVLLDKIATAGRWGGYKGGVTVLPEDAGWGVGLAPLHAGSWRRALALNVWYQEGTGVVVGLPISMRLSRWSLDMADDQSPFSNHEHDAGLPVSYGRRAWALCFGDDLHLAQPRFGLIGLDRYKDWVVEYPETAAAKASYPRAFFSKELAARLKPALDQYPPKARAEVASYYIISGQPEHAVAHAQAVIADLKGGAGLGNWLASGLTHYRQAQFLAFVNKADDALACPDLPPELRAELRVWLALWAHLLSEPDVNPRGAGVHLGNNNMTFNRTCSLPYLAGLLPDHPQYAYWMKQMTDWLSWRLAMQTGWDGPFIECPTYAVYGPMRYILANLMILRNTGYGDLAQLPFVPRFLEYFADLSMPDPRFGGKRIIPGMGNSGNLLESLWGIGMAPTETSPLKPAGFLKFMHGLAQGDMTGSRWEERNTGYALWYLPDVKEQPRELKTAYYPTYGVMFRHHFNTPGETALLLRAGMNWSHWDTDALNTVLYGRGAPLSPGTGYQYLNSPATANGGIYHNRVKVERRDLPELFGRVDGCVRDYGFTGAADYARAARYFPGGLFADGKAMTWHRHVLFVKSATADGPDYFVLRDTFPGGEQRAKWWNWLNLETADKVSVDGQAFAKEATPFNKNVPEAEMPLRRGQTVVMATAYGAATTFQFSRPYDVRARLTFDYPRQDGLPGKETKTIIEAAAKPGEDFFYVVYPHRDGEAAPAPQWLGDAGVKVTTAEATDYVFISDRPVAFDQDGVVFSGLAGTVRVYPDRVALTLNAGTGRVGYKGCVFAGPGPFERVVKLADLKPSVTAVTDTYEKKLETLELGGGLTVEGEGPLTATLADGTFTLKTTGRARVLYVTRPAWLLRPEYRVDGVESMACWTDYPGSEWGRLDHTFLVALPVPAGEHTLTLRNATFPPVWDRQFAPRVALPAAR